MQEIEQLWDAEPGTPESDTLEILITLVEAYERGRYDLPSPDPIAALEYFMESRGWTRMQLEPYIGSRGRVSEDSPSQTALDAPHDPSPRTGHGIPGSVLIQPYETEQGDCQAFDGKRTIERQSAVQ